MSVVLSFLLAMISIIYPAQSVSASQSPEFKEPTWETSHSGLDDDAYFSYAGGSRVLLVSESWMGGTVSTIIDINTGNVVEEYRVEPRFLREGTAFVHDYSVTLFDPTYTESYTIETNGSSRDPYGDIADRGLSWVDDVVYIAVSDSTINGYTTVGVRAVDLYSGEELWATTFDERIKWIVGKDEILVVSDGLFTGISLNTGEQLWARPSQENADSTAIMYFWINGNYYIVGSYLNYFGLTQLDPSLDELHVVTETWEGGGEHGFMFTSDDSFILFKPQSRNYENIRLSDGESVCSGTLPQNSYEFRSGSTFLSVVGERLTVTDLVTCKTLMGLPFPANMHPLAMTLLPEDNVMVLWGENEHKRAETITLLPFGEATEICPGIFQHSISDVLETTASTAFVSAEDTVLRLAPAQNSEAIETLKYCDVVTIREAGAEQVTQDGWIWVTTDSGNAGWVDGRHLTAIQ